MSTPPELTPAALAYLDGRAVHVRSSRRHGCCGGYAAMPTAEPATTTPDGLERFDVADTTIYVEPHLIPTDIPWTIDVDGFARWRRLVVLGLDSTTVNDARPTTGATDLTSDHRPTHETRTHSTATPPGAPRPTPEQR